MAGLNGIIEIKYGEYRPCIVNGRKALFHRWVDNERLILKFNTLLISEVMIREREKFDETLVVPNRASVIPTRSTLALVEYEDGRLETVEPLSMRFVDSRNLFMENHISWMPEKEKTDE